MKGNVGANFLVRTLAAGLATRTGAGDAGSIVELGTVQADGSIKLDGFAHPIPRGDYLVPKRFEAAPLEAGDRVVCIWAGDDLVVLDVVVSS